MSVFSCHFYPFSRSLLLRLITSCYLFPPVGRKSLSPLLLYHVDKQVSAAWEMPGPQAGCPLRACDSAPPCLLPRASHPKLQPRAVAQGGRLSRALPRIARAALVDHHLSPKQDRPSAPRPSRPTRLDLLTSLGSKACHLRGGLWQCRILTHGARPGIAFRFTCPSHLCLSRNWAVQTVRC